MARRDQTAGASGGGEAVARILSLLVILIAAAGAIACLPGKSAETGPPGARDLIGLVGTTTDHAAAMLSKRRFHASHNAVGEFYYASPDGCHAHMRLRLVAMGGLVVGWTRSDDPDRGCLAREAALR